MRKFVLFGAGLLVSLVVAAPAALASPPPPVPVKYPPTCLIANGPHFTKTLVCAGLVNVGPAHAAHGSYSPGINGANAELTVTLEFQRDGGRWNVLAGRTVRGTGHLDALTAPVHPHGLGQLRACVTVTGAAGPGGSGPADGHPVTHALCSVAVSG